MGGEWREGERCVGAAGRWTLWKGGIQGREAEVEEEWGRAGIVEIPLAGEGAQREQLKQVTLASCSAAWERRGGKASVRVEKGAEDAVAVLEVVVHDVDEDIVLKDVVECLSCL